METKKTNWENIVFEYRNKDYGAFRLRRLYPRNISIAIISVIGGYLLLFLIPTLFKKSDKVEEVSQGETTKMIYYAELAPPPPIEKTYVAPPPKTVQKNIVQKVVKYVAPKVTKEEVIETEDLPTVEEVSTNRIGTENVEGTGTQVYDEPVQVAAPPPTPEPEPKKEEKVVYTFVQKQPEFPGGNDALFKFMRENIIYPQIAADNGVQGTVIVQFTVNENGELTDLVVVRSLDRSCDQEALRVIRKMPRWIAGEQNGKKVSVRFTVPIRFIMNS